MEFVVDIQGFKSSNDRFVFKEVAVISLEEDVAPSVYLFKQPFPWRYLPVKYKSDNRWLENNYLGISWTSGDIPYHELPNTLQSKLAKAIKIFVKGAEKKLWLSSVLPNIIINIMEDLECPSLKNLPKESFPCTHHDLCISPTCAAQNTLALKTWLLEFRRNDVMRSMYA